MKRSPRHGLALLFAMAATGASAEYKIDRWTVDGGGGRSESAQYVVTGTIGQADADALQPTTGGSYALTGGFWPASQNEPPSGDDIFRNGFE